MSRNLKETLVILLGVAVLVSMPLLMIKEHWVLDTLEKILAIAASGAGALGAYIVADSDDDSDSVTPGFIVTVIGAVLAIYVIRTV